MIDASTGLAHSFAAWPGGESKAWLRVSPGRWLVAEGPFERWAEAPEQGVALYLNDFSLSEEKPWLVPRTAQWVHERPKPWTQAVAVQWRGADHERFTEAFDPALEAIAAHQLSKIVLTTAERGEWDEASWPAVLAQAVELETRCDCWSYGFHEMGRGFIGATPECLVTLKAGRLQTMAVAGTARASERENFLHHDKDIREHQIVVDEIVRRLASFGQVKKGPREILAFGELIHFITRIEVDGVTAKAEEIIAQLHPTPATGAMPLTDETRPLLHRWRELAQVPANFGAPYGVKDGDFFHALVALRGVWWHGPEVWLPAGCGVVRGSELDKEWRELFLKRQWVKEGLGLRGDSDNEE
jgi:menaquinone-specific isochorismate synthase